MDSYLNSEEVGHGTGRGCFGKAFLICLLTRMLDAGRSAERP